MNKRILTSSLTGLILGLMFSFSAAAETSVQSNHTAANATATTKTTETTKNEQPKIDNLSASQAEMLQDNISALRMQVMNNEQQNLNWWMTFITIIFAVAGIVIAAIGVAIPLLLYKKEKRQLEQSLEQAKEYVEKIKKHHDSAEKYTQDIAEMKQWNPKEQNQEAQTSSIEKAKQLSKNEEIPLIEQLRSQAILLSNKAVQNNSYQNHQQAFYGWQAVLQQDSQDEQANFNAGLEACYLHEKGNREQQIYWLPEIEQYYQQTLAINSGSHSVAYNWGNALNNEAQALVKQGKTEAAFKTWHRAGEKYQQALKIKPEMHEAATNWGNVLNNEAQALAELGETAASLKKWRSAGKKYQLTLSLKPDAYETAYNWGSVLNNEAQILAKLGETSTALEKWRSAGEKYQLALGIKPDMHEAAHNWLNCLLHEYLILKDKQPTEAQAKLKQARHLADDFLNKYPQYEDKLAYPHACLYGSEGNVEEAVQQLRLAQDTIIFLNKTKIEQNPNFNNIRHTPKFQAWFKEAFPEFSAES